MFMQLPPLSGFPNGTPYGLDMTADFAPLFIGMWVVVGLCVLGLALATAVHDTREAKHKTEQVTAPKPPLPKAA